MKRAVVASLFRVSVSRGPTTTLGRGGIWNTTAVALCSGLQKPERCDIYTDVERLYYHRPAVEFKGRQAGTKLLEDCWSGILGRERYYNPALSSGGCAI